MTILKFGVDFRLDLYYVKPADAKLYWRAF